MDIEKVQWYYLDFATMMILVLIWRKKNFKLVILTDRTFGQICTRIWLSCSPWFDILSSVQMVHPFGDDCGEHRAFTSVFLVGLEYFRSFASLRFKWSFTPLRFFCHQSWWARPYLSHRLVRPVDKKLQSLSYCRSGFATGSYTDERTTQTGRGAMLY